MGKEAQFARAEVAPVVAQKLQLEIQGIGVVSRRCADRSTVTTAKSRPDDSLTRDLNRAAEIISRRQDSHLRLIVRKIMKNLLPLLFAVVVGIACFIPAPASAYRYHGRYYPYYYGGHYYRYRYSRALLPVSVSRALLSAPRLGCRRQWASRILSLLVSRLMPAARSPFCEIARVYAPERPWAIFDSKRSVCRNWA